MEKKESVPESDVELVKAVLDMLHHDVALQRLGRALTEEEQRRIDRARAAMPHLEQALAILDANQTPPSP